MGFTADVGLFYVGVESDHRIIFNP